MRMLATLSVTILFGFTLAARAQDGATADSIPSVTVRGEGLAQMKPDFARLAVAVSTTARTLKEASDQQKAKATRALSLLRGLKAKGVQVERSDFTLEQTNGDPADKANPAPQFTAQTVFLVRVDSLENFDADVTSLVNSGLFEISSSAFEIKDPASAVNDARRAAILAAHRSAEAYADAGAFKLVSLEKVLDVTSQPFSALSASPLAVRTAASSTVALEPPARLSFHASVVATWRIAPR